MEPQNLNITNKTQDKDQQKNSPQTNPKSPSETSTPQGMNLPNYKNASLSSKDDISQLKSKIMEQATRLTALEKHKSFCETRISRLTPTQQFPINENNLVQIETDYDGDKKQIMSALRKETLLNEQQRNYIELLKETLENNLLKSGYAGIIQSSNQYQKYTKEKGNMATLADFMVDFSNYRREIERLQHELNIKSNSLDDKTQEILFLNKRLEDMAIQSSLTQKTQQTEKKRNEEMNKNINELIDEKNALMKDINILKKQNQSLQLTISEFQALSKTKEREIQSQGGKIKEMAFDYNEYQNQRALIKQYEDKIDLVNFKYNQLTNEQKETLKEIIQLKETIDKKTIDINKLKEMIKANELDHQKERRNIINLSNEYEVGKKKVENINNELNKEINNSHQIIAELNHKLSIRDNELASVEQQCHDFQLKYKETYLKMTNINEQNEKQQNEAKDYVNQLSKKIDTITEENHSLKESILQITNESSIQNTNYTLLKKDNEESTIAMKNLSDEYNKLFVQYQQVQNERNKYSMETNTFVKESKYWKEKYEKDMNEKDNIIREMNRIKEDDKTKEDQLGKEIEKINNKNNTLTHALKEKNDKEIVLLSQLDKLKQMNENLTRANNKAKEDIQIEKININDLINKNAEIDNHCNDLIETKKQLLEDRKLILCDLNESKQTIKGKNNILNELSSLVFAKKKKLRLLNCNSESFNVFLSNNSNDIQEFLFLSSSEIERLTSIIIRLEVELDETTLQLNLIKKEKESLDNQYKDIQLTYMVVLNENKDIKEIKCQLMHQIDQYKESLNSFKELSKNQGNDISTKKTMLTNASFQIDSYEDKIMLLENERAYLETIILRMCKMFPNANLLQILQNIINLNYKIEEIQAEKTGTSKTNESYAYLHHCLEERLKDKEYQNDILLKELKKAEDYLKVIKDNSLEAQYLNQQLTRKLMEYQNQTPRLMDSFKNSI